MSRTAEPCPAGAPLPPGTWPARLAAALLLVVGLLAMHGLASTHSAMPEAIGAAAVVTEPLQHAAHASTAASHGSGATLGPELPVAHDMTGLCVAVLSSTALAALALGLSRALAGGSAADAAPPTRAAVTSVPRPPPDLRGLCVSRT